MSQSTTAIDRTVEHVAYVDERYMYTDDDGTDHYAPPRNIMCGSWRAGDGTVLCDPCLADRKREYPQGWAYYPGDVCKHGKYTGGCGADIMCGPCEHGE